MTFEGKLRLHLDPRWHAILAAALLEIPVTSHVGHRVKTYLDAVDVVLSETDENMEHAIIQAAAARVCHVWFFG